MAPDKPSPILLAGLAALGHHPLGPIVPPLKAPHRDRPDFSAEDLAWLRALPKKERKRAVEELKAKYR